MLGHDECLNMSIVGILKGMCRKGRMYDDRRAIKNVYTVSHDQLISQWKERVKGILTKNKPWRLTCQSKTKDGVRKEERGKKQSSPPFNLSQFNGATFLVK